MDTGTWGLYYNYTWWGNAIQTAPSVIGKPDFFGSQFEMLTSQQPNQVTNGDFATDSDWFKSSFWTISGGTASMPSTSSYLPLYQNDVTIAGKTYVLNFDIVSITGIIKATSLNNGAASGEITLGEYSTIGNKKITFTTQSGGESIAFARVVGNTASCTIDNVSVQIVRADNVEAVKCIADWIHETQILDV